MESIGLSVNRLIRVSYGPFQLGQLKPGEVEEVRSKILRDQLGLDGAKPDRPETAAHPEKAHSLRPQGPFFPLPVVVHS